MQLKPWPNGLASGRKTRIASGLAMGGQTDSQVGSQVAKSRKFHTYHWLMRFYNNRLLAINLCRLTLGGQTVKNLRLLVSKFEFDQSPRKSSQVGGQRKRKLNTSPKLVSTCESVWPGLNTPFSLSIRFYDRYSFKTALMRSQCGALDALHVPTVF